MKRKAATDNPARTVSNLRTHFNKGHGNLASAGSVAFQFKHMGVFRLSPAAGGTSLVQSQTYRGLGGSRGGRLTFTAIDRIRGAFEAINQAIKQQAEARQRDLG